MKGLMNNIHQFKKVPVQFRSLSTTTRYLDTEKTIVSNGPGKALYKDEGAEAWIKAHKEQYSFENVKVEDLKPVQYFGKNNTPFPLNPTFKAHRPISNEVRTKIFEIYQKNPTTNTPRKIAEIFKLSIERVEAILKLKSLQKELLSKNSNDKSFVLQTQYQIGMEKLLGVTASNFDREELIHFTPQVGKPLFRALDEEIIFTSKDAADSLNRKPFEEVTKSQLQDKPFIYHGLKGDRLPEGKVPAKVLARDELAKHKKSTYMFTDINPNLELKDREVRVREKDGTLRVATPFEKRYRARIKGWPNQMIFFRAEA